MSFVPFHYVEALFFPGELTERALLLTTANPKEPTNLDPDATRDDSQKTVAGCLQISCAFQIHSCFFCHFHLLPHQNATHNALDCDHVIVWQRRVCHARVSNLIAISLSLCMCVSLSSAICKRFQRTTALTCKCWAVYARYCQETILHRYCYVVCLFFVLSFSLTEIWNPECPNNSICPIFRWAAKGICHCCCGVLSPGGDADVHKSSVHAHSGEKRQESFRGPCAVSCIGCVIDSAGWLQWGFPILCVCAF